MTVNCATVKAMTMRLEHRAQHGGERVSLWGIREDCSNNPTVKAIIEIDGMDQHKTELPRFEERPKALDRCEVVKIILLEFSLMVASSLLSPIVTIGNELPM